METIYIKNMVCDRCKQVVKSIFESCGFHVVEVELGYVKLTTCPNDEELVTLGDNLNKQGFELLQDNRKQIVERIKTLIIEMLRNDNVSAQNMNVSMFLSDRLHSDYSALSKLFSCSTGTTIEKYVILQKVELVKELLTYGELSLTEIAVRLGYSSVAYLSAQFKSVTGMTPSAYKADGLKSRRTLDSI